jgi:metal-responsive CopG/Arc/MetJ family transcriptional regulator
VKTIAISIDETTLKVLNELVAKRPGRSRSALVRAALLDFAQREQRRLAEERERAVLKKNRRKLARQAKALIGEQARP